MPTKGDWARTAGQLVQALSACGDDIGSVLGDYDPAVGAWIRFNPLDGKGIRNENVTAFRYALVECDGMDIDRQNALIRELELPVACLVHSGGKSVHAIVHIDAPDYPPSSGSTRRIMPSTASGSNTCTRSAARTVWNSTSRTAIRRACRVCRA